MMEEQKLIDYISGELPESERIEVLTWIKSSPENKTEYNLYRRLFDISLWNKQVPRRSRKGSWMVYSAIAFGIAASLILVGGLMFQAGKNSNHTPPVYLKSVTAPYGREIKVQLADGSDVWLNSGSKLTVDESDKEGNRKVFLEGEGYFNITHDPDHPFIIQTSKLEVKVLGTEFNLISNTEKNIWQTALFNGSVAILDKDEKEILTIAPGTRISLEKGRLVATAINADDYLWKDGILYFNNLPLSDIFDRLSEFYNTDFRYKRSSLPNKAYTGKFRSVDGLEHILNVLKVDNAFSFRAINDSGNNYILIY